MQMRDVVIVGAGLSGLSCAHFLRDKPDLDILLLEQGNRPGGVVESCMEDGYLVEKGPHGFLDNKEASRQLLADLGVDKKLQKAPLGEFNRYICKGGKLLALPQKPQQLLTSPILSPLAKLHILVDLWKKPLPGTPSVSEWAAYRFGQGILPLVDAAITGTHSGDFAKLSIDMVMPGVRDLEKKYGSVLRGLRAKAKESTGGRDLPAMTNFAAGLERLIRELANGKDIKYGETVTGIKPGSEGWQVKTSSGLILAKQVVLAVPVNATLDLLQDYSPPVKKLPVSKICNVALGFADNGAVPKGFGFLVPEVEKRFVLGCMFTSRMYPGRAPNGHILLEVLVGGRRHPERLSFNDDDLISKTIADLRGLLDLPANPSFSTVVRPSCGIPQMEADYLLAHSWLEMNIKPLAGLHVSGFGWSGIGINEMIEGAQKTATAIIEGKEIGDDPAEVKPVYF